MLYIEDNEVHRRLMQGMLGQRPGVDGFEVLARLRADALSAGIPVVAVSANAMPADRARAQAAGFDEYVTKPIDLDSLLAAVDRWLDGRTAG